MPTQCKTNRKGKAALAALAALALAGCGMLPPMPPPEKETAQATQEAPKEEPKAKAPDQPDIAAPPPEVQAVPLSGDPIDSLEPLEMRPAGSMGSLGLNLRTYFEDGSGDSDRIERLEKAVVALQSDLRTAAPAIQRIGVLESEVLLMRRMAEPKQPPVLYEPAPAAGEPEPLQAAPENESDGEGPESPAPQPSPAAPQHETVPPQQKTEAPVHAPSATAQTAAAQKEAPLAQPVPGQATVQRVRIGQDGGKTRLVLDMSAGTPYTRNLDSGEKLLLVELPQAAWSAPKASPTGEGAIAFWSMKPSADGKGSLLVVQLKGAASLGGEGSIPAGRDGVHRLYIDLVPAS